MAIINADVKIHGGAYDCSEAVRMCYAAVGVLAWGYWDSYMWTGNEVDLLTSNGFVEGDLDNPQPGDVLWRKGHTELYLGNNLQGGPRHGDYYGGLDGEYGDQDGTEIARSAYQGWAWTKLLRYVGNHTVNGIPAAIGAVGVMNHIIDHDAAHGYSQPQREGDGTVETITISWDNGLPEKNGWEKVGEKWYYYINGIMQKNYWLSWNKQDPYSNKNYVWYYLGEDGAMYAGQWLHDSSDNKWYFFDEHGIMARNALIPYNGGYCAVGGDGGCVLDGTANVNVKVKGWYVQL